MVEIVGNKEIRDQCISYLQELANSVNIEKVTIEPVLGLKYINLLFKRFGDEIGQKFDVLCNCSNNESLCTMIAVGPESKHKIQSAKDFISQKTEEAKKHVVYLL